MKRRSERTKKKAASHLQIPLTHPATEKITTSNLSSRLLQLPQEIKDQIYTYLLGGQCMHVEGSYDNRIPFQRYVCRATATASSGQRVFDTATRIDTPYKLHSETDQDVDDGPDPSNYFRTDPHRECYYPRSRTGMLMTLKRPNLSRHRKFDGETTHLPVNLLRTCRQIYHDANLIMYLTNTFSFRRPEAAKVFISHVRSIPSGPRLFAVRHLHLHMRIYHRSDETEWNRALYASARAFTNLRSLDISIEQDLWNRKQGDSTEERRKNPSMCADIGFLKSMLNFGKVASLKEMTLVITDMYPQESWRPSKYRWPDAEKQKWAQDVRADILAQAKESSKDQREIGEA